MLSDFSNSLSIVDKIMAEVSAEEEPHEALFTFLPGSTKTNLSCTLIQQFL